MKKISYILFFILLANNIDAQDKRLTFQFKQILFRDLADTIERTIPVKIYYSNHWIDSLFLDINSENESLNALLNKSIAKNGLSFIITDDNKIILSKGYTIKTNFRKEYLEYLQKNLTKADTTNYSRAVIKTEDLLINDEYKVFKIGNPSGKSSDGKVFLTGTITNPATGDPLVGVIVYVAKLKVGAVTNSVGYYSIELPRGQYQVEFRMVGMRQTIRNIIIYSDGILNVEMTESTNQLNEVIVSANRENIVRNVRMGIEKINVKMLKQIPMGMGEVDLFKSSLLLPGVQSVGEASSGYNIRGGSADQNLILLNSAPIINPSHFFGFFSAFNSDMIEDVTLYKSGIPAKYGGRVSSVMDIVLKEGSKEKFNVSGGISPLTGRLMIEGPIIKKKASFIISSRTTYSDWILRQLKNIQLQKSSASFYDIQALLDIDINDKNSISLSGYLSNDYFNYYKESAISYSNQASTLKWRHTYNSRLTSQFSAIISNYNYNSDSKQDSTTFYLLNYKLNQRILRTDFTYRPGEKHKIDFGLDAVSYSLQPGIQVPVGDYSRILAKKLEEERALEPSLYLSDEFDISSRVLISGGLRFTLFTALGPRSQNVYNANTPRSLENIADTIFYRKGDIVKIYPGLEFRFSSRFILTPDLSLKAGVQRNYQYLHMISNTTSMTPTDIWKLSDNYILPQRGDQFSLGIYKNMNSKAIEISLEAYYKRINNILDYKGGAVLLMNDHLETDIINGSGKAYGIEFMIKKQVGMLTGWVSYTYSRTLLKVDGKFEEEKVNAGNYFPANYDKPHDLKFVANAKFFRRLNFTTNFVYNTGRPITYPVAYYNFLNVNRVFYSERNEFRIPDYLRLDFAATLNGNLKAKKLNHSSLTFTVYNALGRRNPYSIFFKAEDGVVKGYQMSIFGQPIFMVTYNFRILGNASTDF
jgi:CarboxypepD_reg-like domain/TonB-dependent Receptor Plug Domain